MPSPLRVRFELILSLLTAALLFASIPLQAQSGLFVSAPGSPYLVGSAPSSMVVGDFNKDGIPDVADIDCPLGSVLNQPTNCQVTVMLGHGDGSLQQPSTSYPYIGLNPVAMASADFNNDGNLDLVTTDNGSDSGAYILTGDGTGGFGLATTIPLAGAGAVVTGDFNHDGNMDFAVVDNQSPGHLYIELGDGHGNFTQASGSPITVANAPSSLAVGDLDGNGTLDLVVGASGGTDRIQVVTEIFLGNGDGTFTFKQSIRPGGTTVSIAVADFNNDSKPDLALAVNNSTIGIYLGAGDGTFTQASGSPITLALAPVSVAAADFTRDGNIDLAVGTTIPTCTSLQPTSCAGGTIVALINNGSAGFTPSPDSPISIGSYFIHAVAPSDFNGDGAVDLAVLQSDFTTNVSGSVAVLLTNSIPTAGLSTSSLDFGGQLVNTTSSPQTLTITNIGSVASRLTISSIAASGDFAVTSNTCASSLGYGQSCTADVTFTPTATGSHLGTLEVTDNDTSSPQMVALSGTGVAPNLTLSSTSLTFGNQPVGTTSSVTNLTLTNTGDWSLSISDIAITSDFSLATNNCGGKLSAIVPNNTCTLGVTFTPSAAGTRNGLLAISDNDPSSPQIVTLAGVGIVPIVAFSAPALTFGSQVVGTTSADQSLTITNNGSAQLSFSGFSVTAEFAIDQTASATTCTASTVLNAGQSCVIAANFTPTATGAQSGTLTIEDSQGTQAVSLSGLGTAAGVSISPSSLTFGSTVVGATSGTESATLTNTGSSNLTITGIAPTGDYAIDTTGTTCSTSTPVAPSGTCTISVAFTPTVAGTRNGTVTIGDNASGGTQTIALSGTGTAPGVSLSPSSLTFGSTAVGSTSAAQSVTLTNTGTSGLTITQIAASGDYAIASTGTTCSTSTPVAPSGTCTISIAFTPVAPGTRNGIVTISDDASGGTQTIALSGTGAATGVSLSPSSLTFGSTVVGSTSGTQSVTLTNTGSSDLTITGIAPTGDYSVVNTGTACSTSAPVAPSGTCTLSVAFTPTAAGTRNGTVTLSDDASTGVQVLALTGTGTAAGVSLSPSSLTFGSTVVGSTSGTQSVTVTNTGTSSLTITGIAASGNYVIDSTGTTCSTSTPVVPSGTCVISIAFTPTAAGTRNGIVAINDDASGGTQAIALSGTGTTPGVSLSPSSLTYGSTVVGTTSTAQMVTVTNTGTSSLTIVGIAISGNYVTVSTGTTCSINTSLAPSGTCTLSVAFTPAAPGTRNGMVTFSDNVGGGVQVVALTGTGTTPGVSLSPSNLTFGSTGVGSTSAAQSVTVTNTGTSDLTITQIASSGNYDIDSTGTTCSTSTTLAPSETCTLSIAFTPTATGTRNGMVTLSDNASGGVQVVAVTGTGAAPGVSLSPSSLTFSSTAVNTTSAAETVTLTNTGNSTLTITGIGVTDDFALDSSGTTCSTITSLAPSQTCTISVTFTPTQIGTRSGVVGITDDAGYQLVTLNGSGIRNRSVALSPTNTRMGSAVVGSTDGPNSITVTNVSNQALQITGIATSGDFGENNNCPSQLAVNGTCTISITFKPSAGGARSGDLTIADNATNNPQVEPLSGTGEDFALAALTTSQTVAAGGSTSYKLQLSPIGGFSGSISLACSGAPAGSTCSVSPSSVTLNSSDSSTVTVNVSTTARSAAPPLAPNPPTVPPAALWLGLLALLGAITLATAGRFAPQPVRAHLLAPFAAILLGVALWASCGGGANLAPQASTGTPAGTSTLTITASSGSLSRTTAVKMTVK